MGDMTLQATTLDGVGDEPWDAVGAGPWEVTDESWRGSAEAKPVVYRDGDTLIIRQHDLVIGRPVAFVFEGVPVVVIKRQSGKVDFFAIPKSK